MRGQWQWRLLWLLNSKFMVSVAGIVLDNQGRVLLQRHRHWVPDVWGLPGGIVHSGEELEAAFAREVWEETGLTVSEVRLVRVVSGYKLRLEAFFQASVVGETKMQLQTSEVLSAHFFSPQALPENMLPQQRQIVAEALMDETGY
ncbi:MAG: NUDIX domain-containing protein [Chloroflexota bacterium]